MQDKSKNIKKSHPFGWLINLGSEGFEPTKDEPADLQSVPFDHSGNSPIKAASRIRTHDPEITNHVLYQLSYSGKHLALSDSLLFVFVSCFVLDVKYYIPNHILCQ